LSGKFQTENLNGKNEVESGLKADEVYRKHGISTETYSTYGGMGASELKRFEDKTLSVTKASRAASSPPARKTESGRLYREV